jgi:DHA1 family tetracycline resistance protein-like MFS transporter
MTEPALPDYETAPAPPPKGALFTIFLIVLADLMGFGVIIPLLPFYGRQYHASDLQIGLLFSIYSVCQMVATPILGLMSDRFGRRPVLVLSQIGSVAGFLLLGFATHDAWVTPRLGLWLVYASRIIDGISGGNISTAQAYISDVTSAKDRARGMGLIGAAFGIGFSLGPAVGGILGHYEPSWPAFVAAFFAALAAVLSLTQLKESRIHKPSETEFWLHPSKFRPILANGVLVQMLLIWFFSMMAFVMMESCIAIYLNDTFGYGVHIVGWIFALAGLVIIIVQGGLIGRLTRAFGEWTLVIAGPMLVSVAMGFYAQAGWMLLAMLLIAATVLNAMGRSLQTPALSALISHTSDRKHQGAVFGLTQMLGALARVIGPMIATGIYTLHHASPFLLAGGVTAAVAVWTIGLRQAAGHTAHSG